MSHNILYIQVVTIMGGAPLSLIQLASRLDSSKFKPLIVTSRQGQFTEELSRAGLAYRIVPMGMWRKGKSFPGIPLSLYRLYKLIKQENISLVHANTLWDNPYAALPANFCNVPAVCHIRSTPRPDMVKKYFLHKASRLICVSEYARKSLGELNEVSLSTIYNGIDLTYGQLHGVSQRVRAELGFSPDNILVGLISRLDPLKGQETLIQAAREVLAKFPKTRFLLAGEPKDKMPDYLHQLKFMVKSAGLDAFFIFTGYYSNTIELTAALDISVLPSFSEGFGRTNLEAMALSKPVVSTNIGGIPEVVEDGLSGFLIPPNDPSKLAQKLMELIADKDKRKNMGQQGYKIVTQKFDLNQQIKKVEALYEELVEK